MIDNSSINWFTQRIRKYKWPLEVHMTTDYGGYSYSAVLNLFRLLYPGGNISLFLFNIYNHKIKQIKYF